MNAKDKENNLAHNLAVVWWQIGPLREKIRKETQKEKFQSSLSFDAELKIQFYR